MRWVPARLGCWRLWVGVHQGVSCCLTPPISQPCIPNQSPSAWWQYESSTDDDAGGSLTTHLDKDGGLHGDYVVEEVGRGGTFTASHHPHHRRPQLVYQSFSSNGHAVEMTSQIDRPIFAPALSPALSLGDILAFLSIGQTGLSCIGGPMVMD